MSGGKSTWMLAADTGGTFTDLIGLAPDGAWHRVKVLSSGVVRFPVRSASGGGNDRLTLVVECGYSLEDNLLSGYRASLGSDQATVAAHSATADGQVTLQLSSDTFPEELPEAIELTADEEAPVLAARLMTQTPLGEALPVHEFKVATTKGTNALLEGKGAKIALFLTEGFEDLLRIGDQKRSDLFALEPVNPQLLAEAAYPVRGRLSAEGEEVQAIDLDDLAARAEEAREAGFTVAALALLHSYRNPAHEQSAAGVLREAGVETICVSSTLAPFIKYLHRARTTAVDASLDPILGGYLGNIGKSVEIDRIKVMTSSGGLVTRRRFHAKDSLLSGPAGGLAAVLRLGQQTAEPKLLSLDMGGTSTDVARVTDHLPYRGFQQVGNVSLYASSLKIETVAAGGGSICGFRDGELYVGPESAGALPGPAAYGRGGPLTVTDVNLLLGRLDPRRFGIPLDVSKAEVAAKQVLDEMAQAGRPAESIEAMLEGFSLLANQAMADAVRRISTREGFDPTEHSLLVFGGAGGQHGCAVARQLGIRRVLSPSDAGLLSAVGLAHARLESVVDEQILRPAEDVLPGLNERIQRMKDAAAKKLLAEEVDGIVEHSVLDLYLRFQGQEHSESVSLLKDRDLLEDFRRRHAELYGYEAEDRPIEAVSLRLVSRLASEAPEAERFDSEQSKHASPEPVGHHSIYLEKTWHSAPVYARSQLRSGATIEGVALIFDQHSLCVVEPGWEATIGSRGTLRLDDTNEATPSLAANAGSSVRSELILRRLEGVVDEMGAMLERVALSPNIRERLDFSCGFLDPDGRLLLNAPHIPVHLGALGLCLRSVREQVEMKPGDVIITNHPAFGGSHLPDVTLLSPCHADDGTLLGYIANRAHHAELGGRLPGSMPPTAKNLAEEGVVVAPQYLQRKGSSHREAIADLLASGPWPSRRVADNLADLDAQLAANRLGVRAVCSLAAEAGVDALLEAMAGRMKHTTQLIRERLGTFAIFPAEEEELLDDDTPLRVRMEFDGECLRVDFSGTGEQRRDNLNATPAIVNSALIYVLRLLIDEAIPLNEGLTQNVELHLPEGSLLNPVFPDDPTQCPPVVAGNVEISQRLVDLLLKPFGVVACSQGTMNNFVFGDASGSHYETIGGGAGAGPQHAGASGIHSHMTNTAITDPEIIERHFPVRVEQFALRQNSGGGGKHAGGNGLVRRFRFLADQEISLLTQHRKILPYGLAGGTPGKAGRQTIERADGGIEILPGMVTEAVAPGDCLIIETPGGGGWGKA